MYLSVINKIGSLKSTNYKYIVNTAVDFLKIKFKNSLTNKM